MEDYRIVLVVPRGYPHAACFREAAILLQASIREAGADCDLTINGFSPERINIVLGAHLLRYGPELSRYRYIPYQLEQLSDNEGAYSPNVETVLSHAHAVWDYPPENTPFPERKGFSARHCPVGYHPALEIIPDARPDTDILFYGSMGERRKRILDAIEEAGMQVTRLFGVYGKERDAIIGRSRIVINIHHYAAAIFEEIRLSYLLNNTRFFLSEASPVNPWPLVPLETGAAEELPSRCRELLDKPDYCRDRAIAASDAFKTHYPMVTTVEQLLE